MKFPSIKTLADNFVNTLLRFPVEVLFALAATIAATVNIELQSISPTAENWCQRMMMTGNLGLLLSLSASLYVQSRNLDVRSKWLIKIPAALLALLLLFIINPGERQSDVIRFFLLSLAFHLLVAFGAFTVKGHINGFWQFNKTLFLRFLTGALYSAVLFAGIAAAIGAMNLLFNFKFEWDTFAILWIWIVGIFNTVFFLAGIPADLKQLDSETAYPKGLKVFTQYVLIPLATIYLVILLAYEAKILLLWNLPKGYVSYLILCYAVFGILSLLLVYPIREHEENKWLKTFARYFYLLLLPLLVLLFVAVGTRVFDYGITEQRYFLIALALWLLFISVYFLVFKKQNIKLIPISLCIITLFCAYGPQSAFSVSMFSQRQILIHLFEKYHAVKDRKLLPLNAAKVSPADGNEMVAKLQYLISQHDIGSLQPYVSDKLSRMIDSASKQQQPGPDTRYSRIKRRRNNVALAINQLGLKNFSGGYAYEIDREGSNAPGSPNRLHFYNFKAKNSVIAIKGYDYMLSANQTDSTVIKINGESLMRSNFSDVEYTLQIGGEKVVFNTDTLAGAMFKKHQLDKFKDVDKFTKLQEGNYTVPDSVLTFTRQLKNYQIDLKLYNFTFSMDTNKVVNDNHADGVYLVKKIR